MLLAGVAALSAAAPAWAGGNVVNGTQARQWLVRMHIAARQRSYPVTLVVTAGFGRGKGKLYDPEVSDGTILVGVENPLDASVAQYQQALSVTPDAQIKTV